jgi:5-methylcytosine-specific restriction endonuclease McrBC regulatory subunit McrC
MRINRRFREYLHVLRTCHVIRVQHQFIWNKDRNTRIILHFWDKSLFMDRLSNVL